MISLPEIRLIVSNSASNNHLNFPNNEFIENNPKYFIIRLSLIKTLKTYIKKYYQSPDKYNVLYLSIAYLDIILSKNKISLSHDKNLKYLCLCCFLLSLKFIGNHYYSKKIISNFCKNYKQEYKIFELQCLMLLEHNLSITTVYDYLSMILIKENKKILNLCNYYLYQICEDKIFTYYPYFYISIAIFQLTKNSISNIKRNHYDKYFQDERVKILIKKFNELINPSLIDDILNMINNDETNNNTNNKSYKNDINIFNNNNIQNNIVIINTFSKNSSNNYNNYNTNDTPRKIVKILSKNFYNNCKEKTQSNKKYDFVTKSSNLLSKSHNDFSKLSECNINYNLLSRMSSVKINNDKSNYETTSFNKSQKKDINEDNDFDSKDSLIKNYYKENTVQIRKNFSNNYYINKNYFSSYNKTKNHIIKNGKVINDNNEEENESEVCKEVKKKGFGNKNTLNFQLVSGVSKEKLLRLSRNLSKTSIKTCDGNK
jgi:hypothetical protein